MPHYNQLALSINPAVVQQVTYAYCKYQQSKHMEYNAVGIFIGTSQAYIAHTCNKFQNNKFS